jgi:8-oxo-dGTP pyrophosphatase MutT (NUDIX family)
MTLTREIIEVALNRPFDARQVWSRFAPELTYGRHRIPPPPDARQAAVLIVLYHDRGQWRLPLIKRTPDVTVHSGQVSFPGGQSEPDETLEETALREFEEELGVRPEHLELCGRLTSTYIYASNFLVTPCVAIAGSRPNFRPNPREVADVLEPGLVDLADPHANQRIEIRRRGLVFQAPSVVFGGQQIWGATSMILAELIARLPSS